MEVVFKWGYYASGLFIHVLRNLIWPPPKDKVIIRSHNDSFFMWPIAYIGLIIGIYSYFEGGRMAVVPSTTTVETVKVSGKEADGDRIAMVLPANTKVEDVEQPKLHITHNRMMGTLYIMALFAFITISFTKLKGVFWWFFYITLILGTFILWQLGTLDHILNYISSLDIRMSCGFYIIFSLLMLANYLVRIHFFDYLTLEWAEFSPGQVRICENFGEGTKIKDSTGLNFERDKSDWTRWLIGFGMGDLTISTTGPNPEVFRLHNVTNIDLKVAQIDKLVRAREIIQKNEAAKVSDKTNETA